MMTAPRVYFAMAGDGVFFRRIASINPRTHAPVAAIVLQGACAIVIALSGTYAQVVNYVVAMDSIFFGLTAICLIVIRRHSQDRRGLPLLGVIIFIAAEWLVVASTFVHDTMRAVIGLTIACTGLPVFFAWRRQR
jgi:APA family basic amino acid/polyamine antiporter